MRSVNPTVAFEIGQAALVFEKQRTGHTPKSATVLLSNDTLVVALHGAFSPAEKALAPSPLGAVPVQEFHRQLFASACDPLRREIERITGVPVRKATVGIEGKSGAVTQVLSTGTIVRVFSLATNVPGGIWCGSAREDS